MKKFLGLWLSGMVIVPVFVSAVWIVLGLFALLTCFSAALPGAVSLRFVKDYLVFFFWNARWIYGPGVIILLIILLADLFLRLSNLGRFRPFRHPVAFDPDSLSPGGSFVTFRSSSTAESEPGVPLCPRCGSPMTWTDGPDVNDQTPRYYCSCRLW